MEALAAPLIQHLIKCVVGELAALPPLILREYLLFRRRKHTIEPSQHGHGQHDALVLWWAIWPAQ